MVNSEIGRTYVFAQNIKKADTQVCPYNINHLLPNNYHSLDSVHTLASQAIEIHTATDVSTK